MLFRSKWCGQEFSVLLKDVIAIEELKKTEDSTAVCIIHLRGAQNPFPSDEPYADIKARIAVALDTGMIPQ